MHCREAPSHGYSEDVYEYVGAFHVHTDYSDGTISLRKLLPVAARCGLDFLITTDHLTLAAAGDGMEGWHGNLLVLTGYEHHDSGRKNHYLIVGLKEVLEFGLHPRTYVRRANARGAAGFIAHPVEKRRAFAAFPPYPWTCWDASGFDGIELCNFMSTWMEKVNLFNGLYYYLFPARALGSLSPSLLHRWNSVNRRRHVSIVGGSDAHGYFFRIGPFRFCIFPYRMMIRSVLTHLLLDRPLERSFEEDRATVIKALREGRSYISNGFSGDARNFRFSVNGDPGKLHPGDSARWKPSMRIDVKVPGDGEIHLYRDGDLLLKHPGRGGVFECPSPGNYHCVVMKGGRWWIVTNHIYLTM
jgi:hypothetical protein